MEEFLNLKITRIAIGALIGIPVTAVSIVLGFHGLVLLYAGIKEFEIFSFSLGIVTITGFIGIIGAWKRIYSSSKNLSEKEKQSIRSMLIIGFLSSIALSYWALSSSEKEISLALFMLSFGALAFIYATPKNSNKRL